MALRLKCSRKFIVLQKNITISFNACVVDTSRDGAKQIPTVKVDYSIL